MKKTRFVTAALLAATVALSSGAQAGDPVGITPDLMSVTVMHNGVATEIVRNQDNANTVNPAFGKTSRKCPPFCIQPITCLLYTSPSPRDLSTSRMPSSA